MFSQPLCRPEPSLVVVVQLQPRNTTENFTPPTYAQTQCFNMRTMISYSCNSEIVILNNCDVFQTGLLHLLKNELIVLNNPTISSVSTYKAFRDWCSSLLSNQVKFPVKRGTAQESKGTTCLKTLTFAFSSTTRTYEEVAVIPNL